MTTEYEIPPADTSFPPHFQPDEHRTVLIGRQPILTRDLKLTAFELLFRTPGALTADVKDEVQASATVISNFVGSFGIEQIVGDYKGFINVGPHLLMSDTLELLPRDKVVLELLETIQVTDEVIARCEDLKSKGFTLALDDNVYDPSYERLYRLVDIVKVDLPQVTADGMPRMMEQYRRFPLKLLAEKVETQLQYQTCLDLGFDLFQGFYFARPSVMQQKGGDISRLTLLRLLDQVTDDSDIDTIEEAFKENPYLTFSLLRLVNSVSMGAREKIRTLRHAIVVLGRDQLRRWVQLALFSCDPGASGHSPLLNLAAMRGKLMEILAERSLGRECAESAFMTGVLSLVDVLFETPMVEILEHLNLTDEVKDALREHKGVLGTLLDLAIRVEESDFTSVDLLLTQLPVGHTQLHMAQMEAINWVNGLASAG